MSRILVAEDSTTQRNILLGILQKLGHEVDIAENGQKAIEKIQADPPDCLLLDMLMPIMDGVAVLEQLESQDIKLPVIVLTADPEEQVKEQCLELGTTTFLLKPVKQDVLKQALDKIFSVSATTEGSCS